MKAARNSSVPGAGRRKQVARTAYRSDRGGAPPSRAHQRGVPPVSLPRRLQRTAIAGTRETRQAAAGVGDARGQTTASPQTAREQAILRVHTLLADAGCMLRSWTSSPTVPAKESLRNLTKPLLCATAAAGAAGREGWAGICTALGCTSSICYERRLVLQAPGERDQGSGLAGSVVVCTLPTLRRLNGS